MLALEKEFNYYLKKQDEFLKNFKGRVIVIKNDAVLGNYCSEIEALSETRKSHELGTFLIQLCTPGNDAYTVTCHSEVFFNEFTLYLNS